MGERSGNEFINFLIPRPHCVSLQSAAGLLLARWYEWEFEMGRRPTAVKILTTASKSLI